MKRLALILALMLPQPSHAAEDGWPALYDVSGVVAGDVLNIRERPDAASPIVGTLGPDTKDVEVIRANDDGTWGLVNTGERSGWASLSYLARQDGQAGGMPPIRQCFGTEPFWTLDHEGAELRLSTMDGPALDGLVSGRFASRSRPDRFVYRGYLRSEDAGPLEITLSLRLEACNDGMSDREYGIDIDMLVRDGDAEDGLRRPFLYSGCCSIRPPAE